MRTTNVVLALGLVLALGAPADARSRNSNKGRHAHHPVISGFLVPQAKWRTDPLPRPSGHLTLSNPNFHEELVVDLYGADGEFDEDALDALNHFWRCKRTVTEKPIEPHLFELLSIIQDHFDGKTIELISGFRNQERTTSYHFHGSASDIRIPGVPDKQLHAFVQTLDEGTMGLGLYPRAGFVHVDVRPESYRWVDYSPAGSSHRTKKSTRRRTPNT